MPTDLDDLVGREAETSGFVSRLCVHTQIMRHAAVASSNLQERLAMLSEKHLSAAALFSLVALPVYLALCFVIISLIPSFPQRFVFGAALILFLAAFLSGFIALIFGFIHAKREAEAHMKRKWTNLALRGALGSLLSTILLILVLLLLSAADI